MLNTGLTEMRGATAPRLQLELICARVLLPALAWLATGGDARGLLWAFPAINLLAWQIVAPQGLKEYPGRGPKSMRHPSRTP